MPASAKLSMFRSTPRKTRLVADLIRGKGVTEAEAILKFTDRRMAKPLLKLLQSAKANAVNNHEMFEDTLFISKILVNEGPRIKRYLPRAKGRADELLKRTCHIELTLDEREGAR
jgi:large subunit ribosomal protein L22